MRTKHFLLAIIAFIVEISFANNVQWSKSTHAVLKEQKSWGLLVYWGKTVNNSLTDIPLHPANLHQWPEYLQSLELNYRLSPKNPLQTWIAPVTYWVALALNLTFRNNDNQTISEFDPYLYFRWGLLNRYAIKLSFAIGEGISYTSSVPPVEKRSGQANKRLLNYLMFESTIATSYLPNWEMVCRIHHRSGAYGLYQAGNSGSNNIGLGLRVFF